VYPFSGAFAAASQYVEMARLLQYICDQELQYKPRVFHGGLSQADRAAALSQFENKTTKQIMILSLRAGGVGLNLTCANHVVHYDRWWNPAVENQATDRVFRIGQMRAVMVHKFITQSTFEERIAGK